MANMGSKYLSGFVSLVLAAALVVYAVVFNCVIYRLQHLHEAVWVRLGKPTMFIRAPSAAWALVGFFFTSEHRRLGDAVLSWYVLSARVLLPLSMALLVIQIWTRFSAHG